MPRFGASLRPPAAEQAHQQSRRDRCREQPPAALRKYAGSLHHRCIGRSQNVRQVFLLVAQVMIEVASGFVARAGILLMAARDGPPQGQRNFSVERRRFLSEDGRHGLRGGFPGKRPAPACQLVKQGAERELVGTMIGGDTAGLLRAHIGHCAHHRAGHGVELGGRRVAASRVGPCMPRQPKVENLDTAVRGQHGVLGLQVAVGDAGRMRGRKAVGELHRDAIELAYTDGAAVDAGA